MGGSVDRPSERSPQSAVAPVAARVLATGADLSDIVDRLVRREGNVNLAEYRVLTVVNERRPEATEPWQIAAALRMSPAYLTTVLGRLHDRGLVLRRAHPGDARRRLITLTAVGEERVIGLAQRVSALEDRLLGAVFSPAERAQLEALLARLDGAVAQLSIPTIRSQVGP